MKNETSPGEKPKSWSWLVKVNFLVLALFLVVYAIYYLKNRNVSFEAVGIENPKAERKARLVTIPSQEKDKKQPASP